MDREIERHQGGNRITRKRPGGGFALIELLIEVVIALLIVTLLLPALLRWNGAKLRSEGRHHGHREQDEF